MMSKCWVGLELPACSVCISVVGRRTFSQRVIILTKWIVIGGLFLTWCLFSRANSISQPVDLLLLSPTISAYSAARSVTVSLLRRSFPWDSSSVIRPSSNKRCNPAVIFEILSCLQNLTHMPSSMKTHLFPPVKTNLSFPGVLTTQFNLSLTIISPCFGS